MVSFALWGVACNVGYHGRDPDGVEPHVLDIIEVVDDSSPGTTAISLGGRVAGWTRVVADGESVGHQLQTDRRSYRDRRHERRRGRT